MPILDQNTNVAAVLARDPVHICNRLANQAGKCQPVTVWMQLPVLPALYFQGMAHNGPLGHAQPWVILKLVSFLLVLDDLVELYVGTHPTQTAMKGLRVRRDHDTVRTSPLLPIVHIPHQRDREVDRCNDLLAGPYKHVAGLVGVDPAPLAPRPRFEDGVHLELPARVVSFSCGSGVEPSPRSHCYLRLSVAVLKVRLGEFAEPVLASSYLCHITVLDCLRAPWRDPSCTINCFSMLQRFPPVWTATL